MYRKILVPLDGSRLSEGILPYVRSFAKTLNIPVELLVVIGPETLSTFSDPRQGRYVDIVEADLKRNSQSYLKGIAGSFPNSSQVTCSTEIGNTAEVIVEKGSPDSDTLIAMATHGRSGVQRWLLGSVADKVLHATVNPVLLVRPANEGQAGGEVVLRKVLVPLDGSELAETVLPHITALAQKMNLEVVLLRVYPVPQNAPHASAGMNPVPAVPDREHIVFPRRSWYGVNVLNFPEGQRPKATDVSPRYGVYSLLTGGYVGEAEAYNPNLDMFFEEIKEEVKNYLEDKVKQLQRQGVNVSYEVLLGDPAGNIIDLANKTPANFIGMCTHGRSGIGRWVLGSVTDRVVRHCGDPVLVVRVTALS